MAITKEYGSAYLHCDDLVKDDRFVQAKVTISKVIPPNTLKAANGKVIPHYTLEFEGREKKLVLCSKTNHYCVGQVAGTMTPEKWPGTSITLRPVVLAEAFGDRNIPAIRIAMPENAAIAKKYRGHFGTSLVGKHYGVAQHE